jgi:hypothetical protein
MEYGSRAAAEWAHGPPSEIMVRTLNQRAG